MLKTQRILCVFILIAVLALLISSCAVPVEEEIAPEIYYWDLELDSELVLPEYPDTVFVVGKDKSQLDNISVIVRYDGEEKTVAEGWPLISAFFIDLNGDGYRELCSMSAFGSGIIHYLYFIYDVHNKILYPNRLKSLENIDLDSLGLTIEDIRFSIGGKLFVKNEELYIRYLNEYESTIAVFGPLKIVDGELVIENKD